MNYENTQEFLVIMGERLKSVRILKGITQKQAAADTGMSQSFLSSVERGKKSACTAQIISLIKYYNVPYEMIFGSMDGDYSLTGFPTDKVSGSLENDSWFRLLEILVGKANSNELIQGADDCLKLYAYVIFRTIYRENPRNSERLFSLDYETSLKAAKYILECAPVNIGRLIHRSRGINPGKFELPPELNGEMRAFIRSCEKLLENAIERRDSQTLSEK